MDTDILEKYVLSIFRVEVNIVTQWPSYRGMVSWKWLLRQWEGKLEVATQGVGGRVLSRPIGSIKRNFGKVPLHIDYTVTRAMVP
jgi:hypothetical protein